MMKRIARMVERWPKAIIITVIIITIIMAYSLYPITGIHLNDDDGKFSPGVEGEPAISFKTDIDQFLPDNPIVRANNRVEEYFGADFFPHVILAEEDNEQDNVLTPKAIREMYNLTVAVRELDGVDGTLSLADAINELVKHVTSNGIRVRKDWINLGRMNFFGTDFLIDDDEIQFYLDTIFGIMNGSVNITEIADMVGQVALLDFFDEVDFILDLVPLLLSEDYSKEITRAESTILIVQMNGTLTSVEAKELAGKIRDETEDMEFHYIKTEQTSQFLLSYDIDKNSEETFKFLAVGIFGLIILVLAISFRKVGYIFIPIVTLMIATVWTIGTMYYLNLTVTAMMVAVIPLIIGLGVDYSVHVLRRYQEELRKGGTVATAIRSSIINVGGAIALAMITTVIAFLSNLTSSVAPIRDFGISCAAGVFYAFLLTMTFHCALRYIIDKRALEKHVRNPKGKKNPLLIGSWHTEKDGKLGLYDRFSNGLSKVVIRYPAPVAILTVIITIGLIFSAINVESEFTVEEFLPDDWASVQTSYRLREDFDVGSYTVAYILIEGEDLATVQSLNAIHDTVERTNDDRHVVMVGETGDRKAMAFSILDLSVFMVGLNSTLQNTYNLTPEGLPNATCTDQDIKAYFDYMYFNDTAPIGNDTFGSFTKQMIHREPDDRTQIGKYTATVIRVVIATFTSTDNREMVKDFDDDIKGIDYGVGTTVTVTGLMVLTINIVDSLQVNMIYSTIIAVILAAIILIFLYRNVLLGLMPPIPVILCSLWIVGTMTILSISLNILTVMVTALTIGLGIDYSIHVMERFREEREKHRRGIEESIHNTIMNTGTALTISAVTTILGFGVLVFSPMPIAQQFGVIVAITIVFSFLASVLVLPIILIIWAKRKEKKELAALPQFSSLEKIEVKKGKK